ncbi:MAG: uroporphyrinogen-III synthase [Ferruginibacter sp.]
MKFVMQQNKFQILCTRPLDSTLIQEANTAGIAIDEISFIETAPIKTQEVKQQIVQAVLSPATIVFTSMNAVDAVVAQKHNLQTDWSIYCIGTTTNKLVSLYFGENSISGTANSAVELAHLIVEDRFAENVIFFCGDQRREELPEILSKSNIEVKEIVVYETIIVPHQISKQYDGILFFSPSAVDSFFSTNIIKQKTILFAIGNTTATAIKKFTNNTIIISDAPGKENLVHTMIKHFSE